MAGKSTRDKDLEALRPKISDLEASIDHVNDRLDEMDEKLKERSAVNQNMKVNVIRVVNVIKKRLLCTDKETYTYLCITLISGKRFCTAYPLVSLIDSIAPRPPPPPHSAGNSVATSSKVVVPLVSTLNMDT